MAGTRRPRRSFGFPGANASSLVVNAPVIRRVGGMRDKQCPQTPLAEDAPSCCALTDTSRQLGIALAAASPAQLTQLAAP